MYIFYFLFISLAFSYNLYVFVCLLCCVCLLVVFYGLVLVGNVCFVCFGQSVFFILCLSVCVCHLSFCVILMLAIFNILNNNNNNNVNSNIYTCLYYSLFLKELFLDDSFLYIFKSLYIVNKVISATCVAAKHVFFLINQNNNNNNASEVAKRVPTSLSVKICRSLL